MYSELDATHIVTGQCLNILARGPGPFKLCVRRAVKPNIFAFSVRAVNYESMELRGAVLWPGRKTRTSHRVRPRGRRLPRRVVCRCAAAGCLQSCRATPGELRRCCKLYLSACASGPYTVGGPSAARSTAGRPHPGRGRSRRAALVLRGIPSARSVVDTFIQQPSRANKGRKRESASRPVCHIGQGWRFNVVAKRGMQSAGRERDGQP